MDLVASIFYRYNTSSTFSRYANDYVKVSPLPSSLKCIYVHYPVIISSHTANILEFLRVSDVRRFMFAWQVYKRQGEGKFR